MAPQDLLSTRAVFFAYPSSHLSVGETIEHACGDLRSRTGHAGVRTWREDEVVGRFVATDVLTRLSESDCLIADVTYLNFNVTFEIGYAIAQGKSIALTRSAGVGTQPEFTEAGVFDTIGYHAYENSEQLLDFLLATSEPHPLLSAPLEPNRKAPVYLMEAKFKTDPVTRMIARVKKARLFFRSFDPIEQPRLSAPEAIRHVSQSYGVLVHLLPTTAADHVVHNNRAAFVAGLALGSEKVLTILQYGDDPVPLDYRDLVTRFHSLDQIDDAIAEFAPRVTEAWQTGRELPTGSPGTFLETLNLGASSAENELRDLSHYFLRTDAYQRAQRGDVRLVVGRKGSGKTAVFAQTRDNLRRSKQNIILDLRPEGYKLLKFKEDVLRLLEQGTFYHTITAFWEYVLLLEVCHKLLEKDRERHKRDSTLFEPYRVIADLYDGDRYISEGDFPERMSRLIDSIRTRHTSNYGSHPKPRLSEPEITELLYDHDVATLRDQVTNYLKRKESIWILFDNLDKGWPTHGLEQEDVLILRALLEATRKLERHLHRNEIDAHTLVFIRNDVYELLVEESPDRGKETKAILDWTDRDLLREIVRRRLVFSGLSDKLTTGEAWLAICTSHINGEESSQYLIDRCLMRPRCLIDIVNYCKSFAVNLRHQRIEIEDIEKGLNAYSTDLVFEVGLEIRDILPEAEDLLYEFIESPQQIPEDRLTQILGQYTEQLREALLDNLLWYGFLGVVRLTGEIDYIYTVNYDMKMLNAIVIKLRDTGLVYCINPAFWSGLQVSIPND